MLTCACTVDMMVIEMLKRLLWRMPFSCQIIIGYVWCIVLLSHYTINVGASILNMVWMHGNCLIFKTFNLFSAKLM